MIPTPMFMDDYIFLLRKGLRFSQANYGDGEWQCMLGYEGRNAQGGEYEPELRAALIATVKDPKFTFFGTNPGPRMRPEVNAWIVDNAHLITWVDKSVLPTWNCRGLLAAFIREVQRHRVLLVGAEHLRRLTIFAPVEFVEVPLPGAWHVHEQTTEAICRGVKDKRAELVLFSSGMATNPVMHALHSRAECLDVTMLDCGAIWDPYAGVWSRKNYQKERFRAEVLPKTLKDLAELQ